MSFTNMPSCMEVLRGRRTTLLLESDWTVMPDSPLTDAKKAEWSTHQFYQANSGDYKSYENDLSVSWSNVKQRKEIQERLGIVSEPSVVYREKIVYREKNQKKKPRLNMDDY